MWINKMWEECIREMLFANGYVFVTYPEQGHTIMTPDFQGQAIFFGLPSITWKRGYVQIVPGQWQVIAAGVTAQGNVPTAFSVFHKAYLVICKLNIL